MKNVKPFVVFAGALLAISVTQAQTIPLNTLTLNGSAQIVDGQYVVLTTTNSQAGSAFTPTSYALGPRSVFEVAFVYNAQAAGIPGDGLAFVAQNTPAGPNFLGTGGSGLGFFTLMPDPAIAATFDFFKNIITGDPADTAAIALPTGTTLATVVPTPSIYGGGGEAGRRYVWVDYTNARKLFRVFYSSTSTKPSAPILSATLPQDLASQFDGQVYFGFTGGTGAVSAHQAILFLKVSVLR